jgi:hypothetical protein
VGFGGFLWISHFGSAGFEFRYEFPVFSSHSEEFYVLGDQRRRLRSASRTGHDSIVPGTVGTTRGRSGAGTMQ